MNTGSKYMSKKIVSSMMVFLITLSIFVAAINVQTANANGNDCGDEVFRFDGDAILILSGVSGNLEVTGEITYNYPPLPPPPLPPRDVEGQKLTATASESTTPTIEPAWDIRVIGEGGFEGAIVGLPGTGLTQMFRIDLILGDVNSDGVVNCRDIRLIFRAWRSSPNSRSRRLRNRWNPDCDLNGDNRVNWRDLRLAIRNLGESAQWEPLEIVEITDTMIYARTDHFSIFRGR